MKRYVVRFVKDVLGDNGREAEICQRWFEIDAEDNEEAAKLAKIRFCDLEQVENWLLHADDIQVLEAEYPRIGP